MGINVGGKKVHRYSKVRHVKTQDFEQTGPAAAQTQVFRGNVHQSWLYYDEMK